ncbi:MAG: DUF2304 domain-containing protein [Lachnospiraceae bacterium]|nr:DUF2304 domain-containing protein [Lachnospiraceae bacterium]
MSLLLRSVLILASVGTTLLIMRKIRKEKMMIEDSLFWIGFSFMLILFSVFPQIVFKMSELVGTQAPANFIFLFIIFVLIVRMFQMSTKISQLEAKMKDLVARIAIDENIRNEKNDPVEEMKEETNS